MGTPPPPKTPRLNLPGACAGNTVDVETATRGTDVGPLRGT